MEKQLDSLQGRNARHVGARWPALRGTILPNWGSSSVRGQLLRGLQAGAGEAGRKSERNDRLQAGHPPGEHVPTTPQIALGRRRRRQSRTCSDGLVWPQSAYGGASSLTEAQFDVLSLLSCPLFTLSHPEKTDSTSTTTQPCQEATVNLQHCCCYQLPQRRAH